MRAAFGLERSFQVTGLTAADIYFACEINPFVEMAARKDPRLIYLLSVAQRRLQRSVAARSENGVTPAQAGLLFVLGKQAGVLMGEAAAALDLGAAGLSGLVDRMAASGLVERRADESDARAWRIYLTTKGRKARTLAKDRAREINFCLVQGFTEEEIDIVARWLNSIVTKFPKGEEE